MLAMGLLLICDGASAEQAVFPSVFVILWMLIVFFPLHFHGRDEILLVLVAAEIKDWENMVKRKLSVLGFLDCFSLFD